MELEHDKGGFKVGVPDLRQWEGLIPERCMEGNKYGMKMPLKKLKWGWGKQSLSQGEAQSDGCSSQQQGITWAGEMVQWRSFEQHSLDIQHPCKFGAGMEAFL